MNKWRILEKSFYSVMFIVLFLIVLFFLSVLGFSGSNETLRRENSYNDRVENVSKNVLYDAAYPKGTSTEYRFNIGPVSPDDYYLMFFVSNELASVTIDNEPIYEFKGDSDFRIKTTFNKWVMIPICDDDAGKEVLVQITPLVLNLSQPDEEFIIGSRYVLLKNLMRKNSGGVFILSAICFFIGVILLLIILVNFIIHAHMRKELIHQFHLEFLIIFVGILQLLDCEITHLIFENSIVIGYIRLCALLLLPISVILFAHARYTECTSKVLKTSALLAAVFIAVVLLLQFFGSCDMRDLLHLYHLELLLSVFITCVITVKHSINKGVFDKINGILFVLLLIYSSCAEYYNFYINNAKSILFGSLLSVILYGIFIFITSYILMRRTSVYDSTGLYNKKFWNGYTENINVREADTVAVIMFDLNHFKQINDIFGHIEGDYLIQNFSGILKKVFAAGAIVCRWGGDEFAVLVEKTDSESVENLIQAVHKRVKKANKGKEILLSFSCGYAISSEDEADSIQQLIRQADKRMYADKQFYKNGCLDCTENGLELLC